MKILLIDDKHNSNLGYGSLFFKSLSDSLKSYIEFSQNLFQLANINADEEVELNFNIKEYSYIFFHSSFVEQKFDSAQTQQFTQLLKDKVYFFSGSNPDNRIKKEMNRETLFKNLKEFLEVRHEIGEFDINVFYDPNYHRFKNAYLRLDEELIENGKSSFLKSKLLPFALSGSGYDVNQTSLKIQELSTIEDYEILEFLNDERIKL